MPRFKHEGKENRNHRVIDILEQFKLSSCYDNNDNKISPHDYEKTNEILKAQIDKSYDFLKAALEETGC